MPRYAIGDIHGGSKTFLALLKQISLKHDDTLYLLGDYVDRGPDSKGVLDTIMQLQSTGFNVRPILGNHDDLLLEAISGKNFISALQYFECWGLHTLGSFGVSNISELPKIYISLLAAMPTIYVEDDYVFAHAGLYMDKHEPIIQTSRNDMMWEEPESVDSYKIGGRSLVVGHRIKTIDEIYASLKTSYIRLDNGAFSGKLPDYGNLVALNLEAMKLFIQPWLDGYVEY
jgi:serine/threonine protein phosphatase 1